MLDTISNIPLALGLCTEVLLNCGSIFFRFMIPLLSVLDDLIKANMGEINSAVIGCGFVDSGENININFCIACLLVATFTIARNFVPLLVT